MWKIWVTSMMVVATCSTLTVIGAPQAVPPPPATASGGASPQQPPVEVLHQDSFVGQDGYNFGFSSSDGTARQERGHLITVGDKQGIAISGSYEYAAPDGQRYLVTYTADQQGYKPEVRLVSGDQAQPQGL